MKIFEHGFTGFHNLLLDKVMPELSPNAWKVLCFIIRQTVGWHRNHKKLRYGRIMRGTGIKSRTTVSTALSELQGYGIVIQTKAPNEPADYSLNLEFEVAEEGGSTEDGSTEDGSTESGLHVKEIHSEKKSVSKTQAPDWASDLALGFFNWLSSRNKISSAHAHITEPEQVEALVQEWQSVLHACVRNRNVTEAEIKLLFAELAREGSRMHSFWIGKGNFLTVSKLNRKSRDGRYFVHMLLDQARAQKAERGGDVDDLFDSMR